MKNPNQGDNKMLEGIEGVESTNFNSVNKNMSIDRMLRIPSNSNQRLTIAPQRAKSFSDSVNISQQSDSRKEDVASFRQLMDNEESSISIKKMRDFLQSDIVRNREIASEVADSLLNSLF